MSSDTEKAFMLFMEVTSHCNMHCTFCPSDNVVRAKQHIREEDAVEFIHFAPEVGGAICLNVLGEPLLNKKVFDYIRLCEENKVAVHLVTNMTLLDDERLRKLLAFTNLTLLLSLHTPTEASFLQRGCKKSFDEYLDILCGTLRAKFKYRSRGEIQVFLATELDSDATQSDVGRVWSLFPDWPVFESGWIRLAKRLSNLAQEIQQEDPAEYQAQMEASLAEYDWRIKCREIFLQPSELPAPRGGDFANERFSWMCMPKVLLNFKTFTLWDRHPYFLQKHVAPGTFLFNEERKGPFYCPGTQNLVLLSNGDYTLCCRDTEGEMKIGNIKDMDPKAALRSEKTRRLREDCSVSKSCRDCFGNTFILDTRPLAGTLQVIDKFGSGFHAFEAGTRGGGGLWADGDARAYFFTRLEATQVSVLLRSTYPSNTKLGLILSRLDDPIDQTFFDELDVEFTATPGQETLLVVPVQLRGATFYRLTLLSPSVVAARTSQNGDVRPGMLAVISMQLLGRPFAATPEATGQTAGLRQVTSAACLSQEVSAGPMMTQEPVDRGMAEAYNDCAARKMLAGDAVEAERGFRQALAVDPNFSQAQVNLAVVLAKRQRFGEATTWLGKGVPGVHPAERGQAQLLLADCRAKAWELTGAKLAEELCVNNQEAR